MDGRNHFKGFKYIFIIPLFLLIYFGHWRYIPLLMVSFSVYDSDEDQKVDGGKFHRSFLTHSLIWSALITAAFYWFDLQLFMDGMFVSSFAIIIHLFLDLFTRDDEKRYRLFKVHHHRVGKYCIRFYKRRLNGTQSVLWLIGNIVLLIVYDVIFLVWLWKRKISDRFTNRRFRRILVHCRSNQWNRFSNWTRWFRWFGKVLG